MTTQPLKEDFEPFDEPEIWSPATRPICQCGKKTSFGCGDKCRFCFYSDQFLGKKIETHLGEANIPKKTAGQAAHMAVHYKNNKNAYPGSLIPEIFSTSAFISGKAGIGKTTLAICSMIHHMEQYFTTAKHFSKDKTFWFETTTEMIQKLRQSFKLSHQEEVELLDKYKNVDFLILDDFGVEKSTDWAYSVLYLIVNHRYEEDKITIFTSNMNLEQLAEKNNDERITRRINDWCRKIEL